MFREIIVYISIYIGLFVAVYYLLSFMSAKEKHKKIHEDKLPEVSIIIPAYNEERDIKETIGSALKLDYPKNKLKVIMIDDGSRDRTYQIAKKIRDERLKIFKKKNAGKASALNYGIARTKSEVIVTMDADTIVEPASLKKMVDFFSDPKIMCVAPSMAVYNPKGILQRVQQIEYFLGVYLRKAFSSMNAVHITPGAFSAYRRTFFERYGNFRLGNLTEDMEMTLRIQYNNFTIECAEDATVYTKAPRRFLDLLKQRRRWYFGLTKNLWEYRALFSRRYGQLGLVVLPVAIISVVLSVFLTGYVMILSLMRLRKELMLIESVNFSFSNMFSINKFVFERYFIILFSNPVFLFAVFFVIVLRIYMYFAKSRIKRYSKIKVGFTLFLVLYGILFVFWWIVSLFYIIFVRKIHWGINKKI